MLGTKLWFLWDLPFQSRQANVDIDAVLEVLQRAKEEKVRYCCMFVFIFLFTWSYHKIRSMLSLEHENFSFAAYFERLQIIA